MAKKLSPLDKIYQYIANKILPNRLIWFCIFRAWGLHQKITKDNDESYKLPSEVLVVDLIKILNENNLNGKILDKTFIFNK
jgi:hypothetical protein